MRNPQEEKRKERGRRRRGGRREEVRDVDEAGREREERERFKNSLSISGSLKMKSQWDRKMALYGALHRLHFKGNRICILGGSQLVGLSL